MDINIKDGSTGNIAEVNSESRVLTQALTASPQLHEALRNGQVYQVQGTANPNNNTVYVLVLDNDSTTKTLVVTYIRCQYFDNSGGTALPTANTYFEVGHGIETAAAGTERTPVNTNAGSANSAEVTCYTASTAQVSGTFAGLDTYYVKGEAELLTYNKEGSLIAPPGKSISIRITTDDTAATAYARISFMMIDPEAY